MEWLFKGLWEFVFWTFTDTTITQPAHTIIWPEGAVTPQLSLQRKKVLNSKKRDHIDPKEQFCFQTRMQKTQLSKLSHFEVSLCNSCTQTERTSRWSYGLPKNKRIPQTKKQKKIISSKNIKWLQHHKGNNC